VNVITPINVLESLRKSVAWDMKVVMIVFIQREHSRFRGKGTRCEGYLKDGLE